MDRFSRHFGFALFCAFVFVVHINKVQAQTPHHVYGLGTLSCDGAVAAAGIAETRKLIEAWAGGYLSGYNRGTIDNRKAFYALNNITPENIIRTLVEFCKKHPSSNLDFAIQTLRFSMKVEDWKGE